MPNMTKEQAIQGAVSLLRTSGKPMNVSMTLHTYGSSMASLDGAVVQFNETSANTLMVSGRNPKFEQRFRRCKDGRYKLDKIASAIRTSLSEQLVVMAKLESWGRKFLAVFEERGVRFSVVDTYRAHNLYSHSLNSEDMLADADVVELLKKGHSFTLCEKWTNDNGFDTDDFLFYITLSVCDEQGNVQFRADRRNEVRSWVDQISEELGEPRETRSEYSAGFPLQEGRVAPEVAASMILEMHAAYVAKVNDLANRIGEQRAAVNRSKEILAGLQKLEIPEYVLLSPSKADGTQVNVGVTMDAEVSDEQARELIAGIYSLCMRLGIKPTRRQSHHFGY